MTSFYTSFCVLFVSFKIADKTIAGISAFLREKQMRETPIFNKGYKQGLEQGMKLATKKEKVINI